MSIMVITVIVGKSCSGKSTHINDIKGYGGSVMVTTTTREPRVGEENGVDYWFSNEVEFKRKLNKGQFIENVSFEVGGNTLYYGLNQWEIDRAIRDELDTSVVLELKGATRLFELLQNDYPDVVLELMVLRCDDEVRRERYLERQGKTEEDWLERDLQDSKDFDSQEGQVLLEELKDMATLISLIDTTNL